MKKVLCKTHNPESITSSSIHCQCTVRIVVKYNKRRNNWHGSARACVQVEMSRKSVDCNAGRLENGPKQKRQQSHACRRWIAFCVCGFERTDLHSHNDERKCYFTLQSPPIILLTILILRRCKQAISRIRMHVKNLFRCVFGYVIKNECGCKHRRNWRHNFLHLEICVKGERYQCIDCSLRCREKSRKKKNCETQSLLQEKRKISKSLRTPQWSVCVCAWTEVRVNFSSRVTHLNQFYYFFFFYEKLTRFERKSHGMWTTIVGTHKMKSQNSPLSLPTKKIKFWKIHTRNKYGSFNNHSNKIHFTLVCAIQNWYQATPSNRLLYACFICRSLFNVESLHLTIARP